jgi:Protein of unknown function (DUF4446)
VRRGDTVPRVFPPVIAASDVIAIAAAAAGAVALIGCVVLALVLGRLRGAQSTVLGERGATDVVAYAVSLEGEVVALRDYLDDVTQRLDQRMRTAEVRIDGAIAGRGLVRYDAYNEMSGHQSLSLALLDDNKSGIVLSSILHRDQARLYVKLVQGGKTELALSPEEEEALSLALERNG